MASTQLSWKATQCTAGGRREDQHVVLGEALQQLGLRNPSAEANHRSGRCGPRSRFELRPLQTVVVDIELDLLGAGPRGQRDGVYRQVSTLVRRSRLKGTWISVSADPLGIIASVSVGTGSTVSDQRDGLLLPDGGRDWLGEFCRQYYYLPALAFWRALEARTLGNRPLTSPSLDVGGYDGTFAATWLGDRPPIDVGLDLEPRRTPDTDRAYRRLVAGNAQALEFADGEFATVVCNSVLEHVSDDVKALGELARVLRSGGELLLSTPSVYLHPYLAGVQRALKTGDKAAAIAYAEETDRRLMHLRYRPFEEWKRLLQERGMDLVEASYYLPRRASTLWDALDHAFTRTVAGRPLYEHLVAGRLWSLDVRRPLAAAGRILLQRPYDVAVRQQDGLRVPGGSLFMRARKLAA